MDSSHYKILAFDKVCKVCINHLNNRKVAILGDSYELRKLMKDKYDIEIRDKKKETEYRAEIPVINEYFETLKKKVINETMTKLLKFYKVEIEV